MQSHLLRRMQMQQVGDVARTPLVHFTSTSCLGNHSADYLTGTHRHNCSFSTVDIPLHPLTLHPLTLTLHLLTLTLLTLRLVHTEL